MLLWGLDTSLSRLVWSTVLVVVLLVLIELAAGLADSRRKSPTPGRAAAPACHRLGDRRRPLEELGPVQLGIQPALRE